MGMNTDATIRLRKSGDIILVPILPSRNAVSPRVAYEHDKIHSEKVGLLVFPDSRTLHSYLYLMSRHAYLMIAFLCHRYFNNSIFIYYRYYLTLK